MPIVYRALTISARDPEFDRIMGPIAECDREVYGRDPSWCEGKTCAPCSRTADGPVKWLFSDAPERCPNCNEPLIDFWSVEGLLADYRIDADRQDHAFVVAYDGERVVGSYRGWSMAAEELDRHLNDGLPDRLRTDRSVTEALRVGYPGSDRFAYESSVFVLPEYQGRGIAGTATRMGQRLLWDAGLRVFVMRTKTYPEAVTYRWYLKHGYAQLCAYPDADRRVVMARNRIERP